jgi:hypothetical protein
VRRTNHQMAESARRVTPGEGAPQYLSHVSATRSAELPAPPSVRHAWQPGNDKGPRSHDCDLKESLAARINHWLALEHEKAR